MAPTPKELVEAREARRIEEFVLDAWGTRREFMTEYVSRLRKLDAFIIGDWSVEMPDGRIVRDRPKIENRVLSKIEDTGSLAGNLLPTIRVEPLNERDYVNSERRERVLQYYWQMSQLKIMLPHLFMDMLGTGMCAMKVWPDFNKELEDRFPIFQRIDPRFLLPPLDYVINGFIEPNDVITHSSVKTRHLERMYPQQADQLRALAEKVYQNMSPQQRRKSIVDTSQVIKIEYWGKDAIMVIALIENYPETAVVLENEYNQAECCPVVLGFRPTADGRIRGKVEAMMPVISAENRLMTYVLDYTDQAVYSPLAKKGGVINAEDFGPNAIIDLGPDGSLERIPPAQVSPEVFRIIQDLERHGRNAGTQPQSRAGNVDQSQASASFVESLSSGLITEVQTLQAVVEEMLRCGNEIAQKEDKAYCDTEKMIYGLAKGGSFREKYTPSELLKDTANFVSWGAGSGLDQTNASVRIDQLQRSGYVSKKWVMEQTPGIENITQEESRIQDEAAIAAYMQGMLAKAAQGDLSALAGWMQARDKAKGNVLEALYDVIKANPQLAQPPQGQPGPSAQAPSAAGETGAMEKGALPSGAPGSAVFNPNAPSGGLPPLQQIMVGG